MALLMMLAIPAMAQEFSGTVEVDCYGDPETVTIANTGTVPFVVDSLTSLDDPRENEPFDVGVEVEVGASVTFETGSAADPALTTDFIFDNEDPGEGVQVIINTEGQGSTVAVSCEEGSGSFGAPGETPTPGKTPDNQQDGDTVTKTFELTLNGDVPEGQAFAVRYGQQQEGDVRVIVFCGDPAALADLPGYEALDECVGDGSVYGESVELERGTTIFSTFERVSGDEEEFFFESNTGEVLDADMTNTAWYTFGGGAGDEQETPDDQQGEVPGEMPDTGMGGLAGGATIPVGNVAAGLAMLAGAGYAVLRRR